MQVRVFARQCSKFVFAGQKFNLFFIGGSLHQNDI